MISARERLASSTLDYYPLSRLAAAGMGDPNRLPMTIKILLEGLLRQAEAGEVGHASLRALTRWREAAPDDAELPYLPSRILLQDFTGVPAVVDLAAMRSAMQRAGKDAGRIDPLVQVDLVIDHSVQVDAFGSLGAYARNIEREYARDRPGPEPDGKVAQARGRQQVRGVLRQRPLHTLGPGSRHPLQHVPGIRRHLFPLPGRRPNPSLPGDDRA